MRRKLIIELEAENAAFDPNPRPELARILHALARSIEHGLWPDAPLYDVNGNKVGSISMAGDWEDIDG